MRLRLALLYPSVMSQYGDHGNVTTVANRCRWRGIDVELQRLELGDDVDPGGFDLLLAGGGADAHQRLVHEDLLKRKAGPIREAVEAGAALLAVCAGYQLLGHAYRTAGGDELPGMGLFDAHTVHRAAQLGVELDSVAAAGRVRSVGNLVVRWGGDLLVGFENHGGRTYLAPGATPLGAVLRGGGNNAEDGYEGCVYKAAIGTYLHGPALPKNPRLADHLIASALAPRHGEVELAPIDDALEQAAHEAAISQALARPRRWRGLLGQGVA